MQDGSGPVGLGQRRALRVGNGDQRELRPAAIDPVQILDVEAAVQGGERARGHFLEQRELQHVGVEVQHVELVNAAAHLVQHRQMCGQVGLQGRGIKADGLVAHRRQAGLGGGVSAGEQRDLVAEVDQRVAEVRHDPFRSAIELRGHRFVERGNLSNFHANRLLGPSAAHAVPPTVRLETRRGFPRPETISRRRTLHPRQRLEALTP